MSRAVHSLHSHSQPENPVDEVDPYLAGKLAPPLSQPASEKRPFAQGAPTQDCDITILLSRDCGSIVTRVCGNMSSCNELPRGDDGNV